MPSCSDPLSHSRRVNIASDLLLVNKADGDLKSAALRTCADYASALRLLRHRPQDPPGFPQAMTISAHTGAGLTEAWENLQTLVQARKAAGHWDTTRAQQARHWFTEEVRQGLLAILTREPARGLLAQYGDRVAQGDTPPEAAAADLLRLLGR